MKRLKKVYVPEQFNLTFSQILFRPPVLFAAARAAATVKGGKNEVNSGLSDE